MRRVVVLGVDGLDWRIVQRELPHLPNLKTFAERGHLSLLPSVFPPDSIPAWITIFTGEPPADHGVIESIDYLSRNPAAATKHASALLRGRTFWDRASESGRKVCIVNPFMAYPAWPLNGVMISGPVFVGEAEPSVYPQNAFPHERLPQLGGIVDFPTDKTMSSFLEETLKTTHVQADFGIEALRVSKAEVFFLNLLTIDRIQHFLWRYCDPDDPTYPGDSELADGIRRAYLVVDEIVGSYAAELGPDDVLVVISDHGHGRRPTRMLYLDELLRREGLADTGGFWQSRRTFALETAKRTVLSLGYRSGQEHHMYRIARRIPGRKALKTSSYSVSEKSLVRASRAFGRNSAGGIEVSERLSSQARNTVIDHLLALLLDLVYPETGERVCVWAGRREDVLHGRRLDRFPDVLFQLQEHVGIDYGVFGSVFARDNTHRRISGGHLPDGVFAASSSDFDCPRSVYEVYGVLVRLSMGDWQEAA